MATLHLPHIHAGMKQDERQRFYHLMDGADGRQHNLLLDKNEWEIRGALDAKTPRDRFDSGGRLVHRCTDLAWWLSGHYVAEAYGPATQFFINGELVTPTHRTPRQQRTQRIVYGHDRSGQPSVATIWENTNV